MKVALLVPGPMARAQYIYKYLDYLDREGISYDVIYWDRYGDEPTEKLGNNYFSFKERMDSYLPVRRKIFAYIRFSLFIRRIIHQKKYDKLILFTTQMAITIWSLCLGRYRGRYLYDYRDLTRERLKPFQILVQRLINRADLFVYSSKGYLPYFNLNGVKASCLCHNDFPNIHRKKEVCLNQSELIRVVYWGSVRQPAFDRRICDLFANDLRFSFTFHGAGIYQELSRYCKEKEYTNISFTGPYKLDAIERFAKETDILFSCYELDFVTKPALAVKIYDSAEYGLPIVVSKGTYMEKYLSGYSHAYMMQDLMTLDGTAKGHKAVLDGLYRWYRGLNRESVEASCEKLISTVRMEDDIFYKCLHKFIEE